MKLDRAYGDSPTRVLLAVLEGHRTYGDLMGRCRMSRATLHHHLLKLTGAGLVAREPNTEGTLRPCVEVVAHAHH